MRLKHPKNQLQTHRQTHRQSLKCQLILRLPILSQSPSQSLHLPNQSLHLPNQSLHLPNRSLHPLPTQKLQQLLRLNQRPLMPSRLLLSPKP
jgi:hypothetical protein